MLKVLLCTLFLVTMAFSSGTRGIVTGPASPAVTQACNYASGWWDWRALDISGQSGDVTVQTMWGSNAILIGVINANATSAATLIVKTVNNPTVALTVPLAAGEKLWPMPEIKTIIKTGTSDSLVFLFQLNSGTN